MAATDKNQGKGATILERSGGIPMDYWFVMRMALRNYISTLEMSIRTAPCGPDEWDLEELEKSKRALAWMCGE
mgnify:CR=1 FL=1